MALFSGSAQRNQSVLLSEIGGIERAQNNKIIEDYLGSSLADLGKGVEQAQPWYQSGIDRLEPWAAQGQKAFGALGDSYGLNGAAGNDNATAMFRASPGYQYNVDQSTDAVARKQSALGMLGSGNTATAIQDRAHNLADQEYKGWQGGLKSLSDIGYNATGQQAQLDRGIGDLYANQGAQSAGLRMGGANMIVGNNTNYMNNLSQLGQNAAKAGQDALASNLNFGLGVGSVVANGLSAWNKVPTGGGGK